LSDTTAAGAPTCYRHPGRETYIRCQRCGRPICPDCMREASVGFQCPDCIAEGRRTTRQPRRSLRGTLGWNRPGATPVTWVLIAINVVVFVLIRVIDSHVFLYDLMLHGQGICDAGRQGAFVGVPREACVGHGVHYLPGVSDGAYWQLVTTMFTHQQIWHIATNMFSLYFVGSALEPALGKARFLALYLISGLAGSAMVYWVADPNQPTLGASGAIFGLLGALLVFLIKARQPLQQVLFLLALNFAITFTIPGISWGAHVGGFLGGVATGAIFAYTRADRRRPLQLTGLVGVAVIIAISVIARTAALA
jgi:membrane associated rhomboid family serine protease